MWSALPIPPQFCSCTGSFAARLLQMVFRKAQTFARAVDKTYPELLQIMTSLDCSLVQWGCNSAVLTVVEIASSYCRWHHCTRVLIQPSRLPDTFEQFVVASSLRSSDSGLSSALAQVPSSIGLLHHANVFESAGIRVEIHFQTLGPRKCVWNHAQSETHIPPLWFVFSAIRINKG